MSNNLIIDCGTLYDIDSTIAFLERAGYKGHIKVILYPHMLRQLGTDENIYETISDLDQGFTCKARGTISKYKGYEAIPITINKIGNKN